MADSKSKFSSDEARKSMDAAINAFSNWRDEIATQSEKNSKAVFDQMAAAAKAVGWPSEFVEMTRSQMQNASKMQLQFMDQVMDIWENQMKNPADAFKPEAWQDAYKKLTANIPGMSNLPAAGGSFPGMPNFRVCRTSPACRTSRAWAAAWASTRSSSGCRLPKCGRSPGNRA